MWSLAFLVVARLVTWSWGDGREIALASDCDGYCGGGGRGRWDRVMMEARSMGIHIIEDQHIAQEDCQPYRLKSMIKTEPFPRD